MNPATGDRSSDEAVRLGHQPETGHRLALSLAGIGLAIVLAASLGTAAVVMYSDGRETTTGRPDGPIFPKPGAEANQRFERQRVEAAQRAALRSYGWADRDSQVATIPIARAMELMAPERLAGETARETGGEP